MKALLDTGPWVALMDRSESLHAQTVTWFQAYRGSLYSTEAVLTEVLYLLNFSCNAQASAMDFILKSIVSLVPANTESIKITKRLMLKYADLPMDYADATLVALAMETGINQIATFDTTDFSIYRSGRNKSFRLLLS